MINPAYGFAPKYEFAILIGGMEGVEDEYKLIRQYHLNVKMMPIASTGGAALKNFHANEEISFGKKMLINEKNYRKLFRILGDKQII